MNEESLRIGLSGTALVVAPEGHMTAALCPALAQRLAVHLRPDSAVESFHLDYAGCRYMDSTFLGQIVSLAKKPNPSGWENPSSMAPIRNA